MKKETFVQWVEASKTQQGADDAISKAFNNVNDTYWMGGIHNDLAFAWDRIIEDVFGKDGYETIMWWMYDNDFGAEDSHIYDMDGNVTETLKTAEELYDFVIGLK